jgi:hypothetical protein
MAAALGYLASAQEFAVLCVKTTNTPWHIYTIPQLRCSKMGTYMFSEKMLSIAV